MSSMSKSSTSSSADLGISGFRPVESGQEALHLLADLVAGGQFLVRREQASTLVGAGEGVVLLLETGHDLGDVRVVLEVRRDLGRPLARGELERVEVEGEAGRVLDALEQDHRCLGI